MDIAKLEKLLAAGHDSAMLRFGLGKACFDARQWQQAERHLNAAIEQQPGYSAAWQLLGQSLHAAGRLDDAIKALDQGISQATDNGDQQALKVMQVIKRRVLKSRDISKKRAHPRVGC